MNNSIYKKGLAVVLIIATIVMTLIGIKLSRKEKEIKFTEDSFNNDMEIESTELYIVIDIDGAVKNPGVYELMDGGRVNDAIVMAGGLKDKAYTRNLNKARKLIDGEKIYIPYENEEIDYVENDLRSSKININTASKDLLMSLTGIGEVYAERIIEYRNAKVFSSIEEIKNIEGIGDKTFEKFKDNITVGK
ncbi:helix-hairpin-helix domain-containing protein [Sedimentibacter sp. MB31-C6]|uniref:helix-hairpin-helix domain-containing protein n=1 Tax=Sedimentibacter sp. MB31-C6 TaxID=3109366 RepID=UPI002DDC99AC|nr:helix-hairpin-helix domain-containing protein [Sedimentibacter sp. MB36-C1]WSI04405.1 helix-hairpin-helix domain-containing protein [Sedimentibacter sp. MB36-C1]